MFVDISTRARLCLLTAFLFVPGLAYGQGGGPNSVQVRVQGPTQRLEMIVNSSRILELDRQIPRALVGNQDIVRVQPISPTQVQVSALKPGVTQINLWDERGEVHAIDLVIYADARQLEMLLRTEFPHAALRVRPLESSVILSGFVDRPDIVGRIVRMAEDYYPKVINNITVGGVQQVALHVKVMEVSRTKLRAFGFDWAVFWDGNTDFAFQGVSGLIANEPGEAIGSLVATGKETAAVGIINNSSSFFGVLKLLRENNLVKVLAEPTLMTVSGRPASFNSGGEYPVPVPQSFGNVTIMFKEYGTRVDFVPIVLGNGHIRLELRPQISELDDSQSVTLNGTTVPGLRSRYVDTGAELRSGQTLAVAGLIQTRTEAQNRGIPWLADLPWAGAAFRRVEERVNEIELLILVRPELVAGLEPHEVPRCGPGESTTSPGDVGLYWRGYLEVPKCCSDGSCDRCQGGGVMVDPSSPMGPNMAPPGSVTIPQEGNGYELIQPSLEMPSDAGASRSRLPLGSRQIQRPTVQRASAPQYSVSSYQTPVRQPDGRYSVQRTPVQYNPSRRSDTVRSQGLIGPTGYDTLDD